MGQEEKFPKEHLVLIVGEVRDVSEPLAAALAGDQFRVRRLLPGAEARQLPGDCYEVDFSSPASLARLHELLRGSDQAVVGSIINLLGLSEPFAQPGWKDVDAPVTVCQWTFNLVKEFEDDLRASADQGGGWYLNHTALGGTFGLNDCETSALSAAGTLGIAKTLLRESPRLTVKAIDVDVAMEPPLLVSKLLDELNHGGDLVEVGLTRQGRWRLELAQDPISTAQLSPLPIDGESVVLVTGGAYGVTAEVTKALAVAARPRLILVGRSELPPPESPETANLDASGLRKHLVQEARSREQRPTPADIERAVGRILKNREILANIEACRAAGSTVEYHALDARDRGQLGGLIDDLYARFGRLDGVIHGAGIIEDKRIRDKTPESFANVFRTKVDSALILAEKLRPENLKFLVFFSSVSGRFGNAGQVDYSAANEFLNKLANYLDRRWNARVVAINWGPWDGGMVSDDLRRMYASVGFDLIPVDVGADFLLSELRLTSWRSPEVVVSGSVDQMLASGREK